MTLMAPMIELMPIMWMAKIAIGTLSPPCSDSGGYSVQPPAGAPPGTNSVLDSSSVNANGRIQKRPVVHARQRHVRRADLHRDHPVRQAHPGRHHAPKIITSACTVVIELKNSGSTNCRPGWNSSARMTAPSRRR
jgi:hypothetical protein